MGPLKDDKEKVWKLEEDRVRIISSRNFGWNIKLIREAFSLYPVRHVHSRRFKKCDEIVREFLMCPVHPECILCILKCSLHHMKHILLIQRGWEEAESVETTLGTMKELVQELRKALQGTSNSSSPNSNRISYQFMKAIKVIVLGAHLFHQLALQLAKGHIPTEFQHSKGVMIPKPSKDHKHIKG